MDSTHHRHLGPDCYHACGISLFIIIQSCSSRAGAQYSMLAPSSGDVVNCRRHEMCGGRKFKIITSTFFLSKSQSKFHTTYTVYFYIQTHHVSTYSSYSLLYIFIQFIDILRTYSKGTSSESDFQIYTCLYVCIILVQWNYTVDVLESYTDILQYMWLLDCSIVLHSWTILIACKKSSSYPISQFLTHSVLLRGNCESRKLTVRVGILGGWELRTNWATP